MKQSLKRFLLSLAFVAVCGILSAVEVTVDGIKYEVIKKTKTATLIDGKNYFGDLVIPEFITYEDVDCAVTSIGERAFYYSSLTSVTIPNSVTCIENEAFEFCRSLSSVHIFDIAKWCTINFGDLDSNPLTYGHNLYLNGELVTDLVIPNSELILLIGLFLGAAPLLQLLFIMQWQALVWVHSAIVTLHSLQFIFLILLHGVI